MRHMDDPKVTEPSVTYNAVAKRDNFGRFATEYQARSKLIEGTLRRAVSQDAHKLRRACDRILDSAAEGETWQERMAAFSIIADRLDGKAVARIETTDGAPRDLGLAEIVALVLQHRKAEAIDAPSDTPGGTGDIPVERGEAAPG